MRVLIIFIFFALAVFFIGCYVSYRKVFFVDRAKTLDPYKMIPHDEQYEPYSEQMFKLISTADALPYESLTTLSRDGLRLYARLYKCEGANEGTPVQILFHGYRSNGVRDFSGGVQLALECGYNAILVDERAHGKSEGSSLSFGINERLDCLSWVNFVRDNFGEDTPVFLVGISMGAASVLMAADLPFPKSVRGIIADCGYTSPKAIIRKVMSEDMGMPAQLLYPFVRLGGRIYGGFDIEAHSAPEALGKTALPVLLIHGEDDRFVPCEMSRENAAACKGPCTLLTVPRAAHGISYLVDCEAYRNAVVQFLNQFGQG